RSLHDGLLCSSHAAATAANFPLSLHDALPIWRRLRDEDEGAPSAFERRTDRGNERLVLRLRDRTEAERSRLGPDRVQELETLVRSEEHTSELQSQSNLVCRLLLEKKKR